MTNIARPFDTAVTRQISRLPKALHRPFALLAYPTMPLAWAIVMALVILLDFADNKAAAIAVLILLPAATIIKLAFRRQRPPTIYAGGMRIKSYSFPSSHSYCSALGGIFLSSVAISHNITVLAVALLALPIIVGVSRIYVGAHYPSDVLAGWVSGAVLAFIVLTIW